MLLLFLTIILLTGTQAASNLEIRKELEKVSYYAQEYESGNLDYAKFLTKVDSAESEVSAILSNPPELEEEEITKILGEPEKISWVVDERTNSEKQIEKPTDFWKDIAYDGKVRVNRKLIPTSSQQGNKEVITHKAEFVVNFKESPSLDFKERINEIQKLAKTLNLNPSDIQTANKLAKETANLQNLFNEYMQKSPEKCEEVMDKILGEENLNSDQRIITQEYEIANANGIKTIAKVEMCDNCQGQGTNVWSWMNVQINMVKDGKTLTYPVKPTETVEDFKTLDDNEVKRNLINDMRILKELLQAGNYRAAALVAQRIKIINDAWTEKSNDVWHQVKSESDPKKAESDLREKAFGDKKQFYSGLFEGYTLKSSYIEQQEYEKNLVQEFNEGGEEICNNRIDDNSNEKVDCLDELCSGKVCGVITINSTIENKTTQETKELYCIAQTCKMKKDEKNEENVSVCGNKICEDGETETCSEDCKSCPTYPPLECFGKVIFKGTDANGCPLEPLCIQEKNSCTISSECATPLCGVSECIEGECKITNLEQCREQQCIEGEEKTQNCDSGEKIIIEKCLNSVWKRTGAICNVPVGGPTQSISETRDNSCQLKIDCKEGHVCSGGKCILVPINSKKVISPEATSIKGTSFTGDAISITSTGITGLIEPSEEEPIDYIRQIESESNEKKQGAFTGVARDENLEEFPEQTQTATASTETLSREEKTVFSVKGTCKTTNQETTSLLTFTGLGETFSTASTLQERYEEKGSEWCKWKLENLLKERKELENSFNEEYARWFFEEYLPNSAEDWEGKKQAIVKIHLKNIENQIETAKMMECAGIKELSEYSLINIKYEAAFGSLEYNEKVDDVRFEGMTRDVKIISPSLKLVIIPSKEFIKEELKKEMNNYDFPGSIESKSQRKRTGGLTSEELQIIRDNPELLAKIKTLAEGYQDGYLNVQISITDNEEIIYNLYAKLNSEEIKVQPLPPKNVPKKDVEITIPFESIYEVIKKGMETSYIIYAPWDKSIRPVEKAKTISNLISAWLKTRSMMSSIEVNPPRLESSIKDLFKEIFFVIQEDKTKDEITKTTEEKQIITWDSKGQVRVTNLK